MDKIIECLYMENLSKREIFALIALYRNKSPKQLNKYSDELNDLVKKGFVNWTKQKYVLAEKVSQTLTEIFQANAEIIKETKKNLQLKKQH